jgi:hypothetical protein
MTRDHLAQLRLAVCSRVYNFKPNIGSRSVDRWFYGRHCRLSRVY